jgi:hypothetical protein
MMERLGMRQLAEIGIMARLNAPPPTDGPKR